MKTNYGITNMVMIIY